MVVCVKPVCFCAHKYTHTMYVCGDVWFIAFASVAGPFVSHANAQRSLCNWSEPLKALLPYGPQKNWMSVHPSIAFNCPEHVPRLSIQWFLHGLNTLISNRPWDHFPPWLPDWPDNAVKLRMLHVALFSMYSTMFLSSNVISRRGIGVLTFLEPPWNMKWCNWVNVISSCLLHQVRQDQNKLYFRCRKICCGHPWSICNHYTYTLLHTMNP